MKTIAAFHITLTFLLLIVTGPPLGAQDGNSDAKPSTTGVRFPVGRFQADLSGWPSGNIYGKKSSEIIPLVLEIDSTGKVSATVDCALDETKHRQNYDDAGFWRITFRLDGQIDPNTGRAVLRISKGTKERRERNSSSWKCNFEQEITGWFFPPNSTRLISHFEKGQAGLEKHPSFAETRGRYWTGETPRQLASDPWIGWGPDFSGEGHVQIGSFKRYCPRSGVTDETHQWTQNFRNNPDWGSLWIRILGTIPVSTTASAPVEKPIPKPVKPPEPAPPVPDPIPRPRPLPSLDDALKMSVRLLAPDPKADLDGDGEVTAADARLIREAETDAEG